MQETIFAAVYCRYSSTSHQTDQSIEGQLAAAQKYAAAHGMTIIREYCDRGISGRSDDRAEFQRLLRDSAKHEWSALIVWKTDRIGRNREELAINKSRLKKNGVKIFTVAETIPDTPEGIILESVLEGFAEYYSVQLAANVKRGLRESAKKGNTVGHIIFGFTRSADKRVIIEPTEAAIVQRVFREYTSSVPTKEIIEKLNEEGLRCRGRLFNYNTILRILKNRKYIGEYRWDGELLGELPRIIDDATFEKAQYMISANRRAPSRVWTHIDYLLTGKLFCGHCESAMVGVSGTGKNGTRHHYYECMGHRKKTCHKKTVRKEWIEDLVLSEIRAVLSDDALLDAIAQKAYDIYASETDTSYVDSLQKQLSEAEKGISNIVRAVEAGMFSPALRERMEALEAQKAELEASLAAARLDASMEISKDMILFGLHKMREYTPEDPEARSRLIDAFINAVYLFDDKLLISFNYTNGTRRVPLSEISFSSSCSYSLTNSSPIITDTNTLCLIFFDQRVFVTKKEIYSH